MEPSLNAQFTDLQGDIGHYLGYGRGEGNGDPAWDSVQAADVARCVKGGMRKFYYCGYTWSFLKQKATLTLTEDVSTVSLPDDYGGYDGAVTVLSSGSSVQPWKIEWRSEPGIRELYSMNPSAAGAPGFVAEQRITYPSANNSGRWQLVFFPIPDQAYTVELLYNLNPNYLSGQLPYAYGGQEHAETLLESCLQVAEIIKDDITDGPHAREFARLLEVSKEIDRRKKPQGLGYNDDNSDRREWGTRRHWQYPAMTYNGSSYG